jgi:serine/threonine-protein kinase RsbW
MPVSPQGRSQTWHRVFKGAILEIPAAASWIESVAAELGLPESQAFAMQVCLEELMSNIVRHGPEKPDGPHINSDYPLSISVTVEAVPDRVIMSVEDNGRPFDVGQAPAKAIDQPLEQVQSGGLGIHLIRNFATNLEYCRTERGNRVMLEFKG